MAGIERRENRPDEGQPESAFTSPAAIERRVQKNIFISIALFILIAAIFGSRRFLLGVCLGGLLAYLNYRWLHTSLKTLFAAIAAGAAPPDAYQSVAKFILRWLVVLAS